MKYIMVRGMLCVIKVRQKQKYEEGCTNREELSSTKSWSDINQEGDEQDLG